MLSGATTCSVTLGRYRLLVVDEVGYIPFEPEVANLFFQLVSRGPLSAAPTAAAGRCLTPSFGRSRGQGPDPAPAALYGAYTAWNRHQGASFTAAVGQARHRCF